MHSGLMMAESMDELREQLDLTLRECAVLKKEVDTLTVQCQAAEAAAGEHHVVAAASVEALHKAKADVKALQHERKQLRVVVVVCPLPPPPPPPCPTPPPPVTAAAPRAGPRSTSAA
jgi:hypothetical protein